MRKKGFKLSGERRHKLEGLIFVSPFIIGTLIFFIFPLFVSVKLSFGKVIDMQKVRINWIGLENYVRAFIIDTEFIPMFLQVVGKTIMQVPLIIVFSVLLSMLVNKDIKFKGFYRTVFFIPFLLGTGEVMNIILGLEIDKHVVSLIESNLLPSELLAYLGHKVVQAVDSFFGIIVVVLWSSGVQILLFLSGLQGIPVSLYESAKVDGATEWDMFWKITLPMISPIMLLTTVYTIIALFTDISNPILGYIKTHAFDRINFEYAAAIGWIYFLFIIGLVSAIFMVFKNYIYTTSESKGVIKVERKYLR